MTRKQQMRVRSSNEIQNGGVSKSADGRGNIRQKDCGTVLVRIEWPLP